MTTKCCLCLRDINPHDLSSWKEVTGFVGGPKKDSMVLRTDTGRYACTPCIHKAKEGQAPDQPSLLDEPIELPSREMIERLDEAEKSMLDEE